MKQVKREVKVITEEMYFDKAQNGARELFEFKQYRVLDGTKGEDDSYFIIDDSADVLYEIDVKTCYDLVTFYHHGFRDYLLEEIEEVLSLIK